MKKVLVGGVFDILHFGHISFLKSAKALGDYLVVALESDETTRKLKGTSRPIHTQKQRKVMLEAVRFVDQVISLPIMKSDIDYENLVKKVKPNIIAVTKGDPALVKKQAHAEKVNASVVEIEKIKSRSTSDIAKILETADSI